MYLLQWRIRVMVLYQHDKKSWDYWYSYLKSTTTGGTSPLSPTQRNVWTHWHLCVYACSMCELVSVWVVFSGRSCLSYFFWKFKILSSGSGSQAAVKRFTRVPHKSETYSEHLNISCLLYFAYIVCCGMQDHYNRKRTRNNVLWRVNNNSLQVAEQFH